jgi:hypothetical protein
VVAVRHPAPRRRIRGVVPGVVPGVGAVEGAVVGAVEAQRVMR